MLEYVHTMVHDTMTSACSSLINMSMSPNLSFTLYCLLRCVRLILRAAHYRRLTHDLFISLTIVKSLCIVGQVILRKALIKQKTSRFMVLWQHAALIFGCAFLSLFHWFWVWEYCLPFQLIQYWGQFHTKVTIFIISGIARLGYRLYTTPCIMVMSHAIHCSSHT